MCVCVCVLNLFTKLNVKLKTKLSNINSRFTCRHIEINPRINTERIKFIKELNK